MSVASRAVGLLAALAFVPTGAGWAKDLFDNQSVNKDGTVRSRPPSYKFYLTPRNSIQNGTLALASVREGYGMSTFFLAENMSFSGTATLKFEIEKSLLETWSNPGCMHQFVLVSEGERTIDDLKILFSRYKCGLTPRSDLVKRNWIPFSCGSMKLYGFAVKGRVRVSESVWNRCLESGVTGDLKVPSRPKESVYYLETTNCSSCNAVPGGSQNEGLMVLLPESTGNGSPGKKVREVAIKYRGEAGKDTFTYELSVPLERGEVEVGYPVVSLSGAVFGTVEKLTGDEAWIQTIVVRPWR